MNLFIGDRFLEYVGPSRSAGREGMLATHTGSLCKTWRADDGPLLSCWQGVNYICFCLFV